MMKQSEHREKLIEAVQPYQDRITQLKAEIEALREDCKNWDNTYCKVLKLRGEDTDLLHDVMDYFETLGVDVPARLASLVCDRLEGLRTRLTE